MSERRLGLGLLCALATASVLACSSGDDDTAPASGGASGAGGSAASGGGAGVPAAGMGGGAPMATSFARDIKPVFGGSCVFCHYTGGVLVDIADPFAPGTGLVGSDNSWATDHPEGHTPAKNVVPGDPTQSFLLTKIGDPNLDTATAGSFMPWQVPPLTADEIEALRQWITDGALNDDTFATTIVRIFGTAGKLGGAGGKCTYCHFAGGQLPNLSDPFDPVTGAVNVPSTRAGIDRIEPGDPDASYLFKKVTQTAETPLGAPMPRHFPALTSAEVELVRAWIQEGARNN